MYFLVNMKYWHLPVNSSAQVAPDYVSEYLNFHNFPEGDVARPLQHVAPWALLMGANAPILFLPSICSTNAYKQKVHRNAPEVVFK